MQGSESHWTNWSAVTYDFYQGFQIVKFSELWYRINRHYPPKCSGQTSKCENENTTSSLENSNGEFRTQMPV